MLSKKVNVIGIKKGKLIAAKISGKKIKKSLEYNWDFQTLDIALSKAVSDLKAKTIRVLIGSDMSYVLRLKVPADMGSLDQRKYIAEKISEQIPEELTDSDWDFKELHFNVEKASQTRKDIVVFAPVKGLFKLLSEALKKLKVNAEVIEPEVIAATRDKNPLVGIALKRDVEGKDEETLNLKPIASSTPDEEEKPSEDDTLLTEEAKKIKVDEIENVVDRNLENDIKIPKEDGSSKSKLIIVLVFLVTLGIVVGSILYLIRSGRINSTMLGGITSRFGAEKEDEMSTPDSEKSVEEELGEEQVETKAPTQEPEVVDLAELSLQIQNGTGVAGEADFASDILLAEGFVLFDTANADSFDYLASEVRLKEGLTDTVFTTIERALNSDFTVEKGENLSEDSEFDVVIIIGKRSN